MVSASQNLGGRRNPRGASGPCPPGAGDGIVQNKPNFAPPEAPVGGNCAEQSQFQAGRIGANSCRGNGLCRTSLNWGSGKTKPISCEWAERPAGLRASCGRDTQRCSAPGRPAKKRLPASLRAEAAVQNKANFHPAGSALTVA
jgi:hypothetical protein